MREDAIPYADCQECGARPCYCGLYDAQPVPKLSYSTWGELYMYRVYDRYYDYENGCIWRGSRCKDPTRGGRIGP